MEANLSQLGQMLEPQRRKRTWVLLGFILFAFVAVMIGILSFSDALFGKTMERRAAGLKALEERGFNWEQLLGDQEQNRLAILKAKASDIDQDGLSDYDESKVFGTSIYLLDSDSDGISDFEEVQKGSNPNCDETKLNCFIPLESDQTAGAQLVQNVKKEQVSYSEALANPVIQSQLQEVLTPAEMRQLLYKSGFDSAKVAELSVEQLNQLRDVLVQGQFNPPQDSEQIVAQLQSKPLETFSRTELEQLVKQIGFPEDLVSIIPQEELVSMIKETLNELVTQSTQESLVSGKTNQNP